MDEARCKCRRDKRNLTPSDWAIKLGIGPTRQRAHTLLSSLYILPSTLCALVQLVGNAGASCSSAWATSKCANAATYLKRVLRRRGGPPNCKLHPSSSPAIGPQPLCVHTLVLGGASFSWARDSLATVPPALGSRGILPDSSLALSNRGLIHSGPRSFPGRALGCWDAPWSRIREEEGKRAVWSYRWLATADEMVGRGRAGGHRAIDVRGSVRSQRRAWHGVGDGRMRESPRGRDGGVWPQSTRWLVVAELGKHA